MCFLFIHYQKSKYNDVANLTNAYKMAPSSTQTFDSREIFSVTRL